MPADIHNLARKLMADPDFEPQKGRTKEQSAFAVATAQIARTKMARIALKKRRKR